MIADRIYATLKDAQDYVNDLSTTASAVPGLVLSVVNDGKNNGIYYIQSIGQATAGEKEYTEGVSTPGVLIPAGAGAGSETVNTYKDAKAAATEDNLGQILYVKKTTYQKGNDYTEDSSQADKDKDGNIVATYEAGPYIVTGKETLSKLGVTSASGNLASDVEAIKGRVSANESSISNILSAIEGGVHFAGVIHSYKGALPEYDEMNGIFSWLYKDGEHEEDYQQTYTRKFEEGDIIIVVDSVKSPEYAEEPTKEYILYYDIESYTWIELGTCSISDQKIAELETSFNNHVTNMNTALAPTIAAASDYATNKDSFALKSQLSGYVPTKTGYGLSKNDFTDTLKNKLDNIATGAQVNVIEEVKVDGEVLDITGKSVNIDIPQYIAQDLKINGLAADIVSKTDGTKHAKIDLAAHDILLTSDMGDLLQEENSVQEALEYVHDIANTKIGRVYLSNTGADDITSNVLGLSKTVKDNDTIKFKIAAGSSISATAEGLDLV